MAFAKYAKYYDDIYNDKNYKEETEYLVKIIKKFSKKKNLLEVGCGSGQHAIHLKKHTYKVTAIDNSASMIEVAKNKEIKIKFFKKDARTFKLNKKFDIILLNFHVINFLLNKNDLKKFFSNCFIHLKKEGILIFDFINLETILKDKPKNKIKKIFINNKKINIIRNTRPFFEKKNKKFNIRFDLKVFKEKKLIESFKEIHKLKIHSKNDFVSTSCKYFNLINIFGWLSFSNLKNNAWTGLMVLKRLK